uniref:PHB domain-containing protein n=1 Tax=Elaeophora elaphi TaxID=1147741 RepID=A0A0R3S223_9BILA
MLPEYIFLDYLSYTDMTNLMDDNADGPKYYVKTESGSNGSMSSKNARTDPQWVTPSSNQDVPPDYETIGTIFGYALLVLSWILIIITFPFSMCVCLKVIKEYERVVIFRIGRLVFGGARGPGMIFVIPCIDTYRKIDLRLLFPFFIFSFSK